MKSKFVKAICAALGLAIATATPANETTPTEAGLLVGKATAQHKLIGWASYTCPHCAQFAAEGEPALALAYLPTGKLNYEIRPFIRNIVDITASLAVSCGDPSKYLSNHSLMMGNQEVWMKKAQQASPAQTQRWGNGSFPERMRAIAGDLDFYELMARNGYRQTDLDKCLADEAKATKIAERSRADAIAFDIKGTPSFALDGKLLDGAHSWAVVEERLNAALN